MCDGTADSVEVWGCGGVVTGEQLGQLAEIVQLEVSGLTYPRG